MLAEVESREGNQSNPHEVEEHDQHFEVARNAEAGVEVGNDEKRKRDGDHAVARGLAVVAVTVELFDVLIHVNGARVGVDHFEERFEVNESGSLHEHDERRFDVIADDVANEGVHEHQKEDEIRREK